MDENEAVESQEQPVAPEFEEQAEEQPQADVVPLSRSEFNRLQAANRINAREAQVAREQTAALYNFLQQAAAANQAQQPQDEEDDNPVNKLLKGQEKIEAEFKKQQEREQQRAQEAQIQAVEQFANQQIHEVIQEGGAVAQGAFSYLATLMQRDLEDRFPTASEAELLAYAKQGFRQEKLGILNRGEDVGLKLLEKAVRFGFNPNSVAQPQTQPQAQPQVQAKAGNAKQQIAGEKRRANSGTIAGIENASATPGVRPSDFRNLSGEQFNEKINDLKASGLLRTIGGGRFGMKLVDLLPGKGMN